MAAFLLLSLCAGCQGPQTENEAVSQVTRQRSADAQPAPARRADEADINALLEDAEAAMATEHFIYPAGNSALAAYDRVLILDPDNKIALRGIEDIAGHYLAKAMDAADKRRFEQARAYLDQAQMVDPQHPGVIPTREQITMLSEARRKIVSLDPDLLKARDPLLLESLRGAGGQSRQPGCRAVIHARSDAEGRWIYQQMSNGAGPASGDRVRANVQISWPARIEVLCFPDQAQQ